MSETRGLYKGPLVARRGKGFLSLVSVFAPPKTHTFASHKALAKEVLTRVTAAVPILVAVGLARLRLCGHWRDQNGGGGVQGHWEEKAEKSIFDGESVRK